MEKTSPQANLPSPAVNDLREMESQFVRRLKSRATARVKIVRAESADAVRLSEIARAAKSLWGYPPEWLEAWHDSLAVTAEFVRQNETYKALFAGSLVGFSALVLSRGKLCLDHFWVIPEMVGRGIGRQLFEHALKRGQELGFADIEIEADPNAEGFYHRMGAVRKSFIVRQVRGDRRELPVLTCATKRRINSATKRAAIAPKR